MENDDNPFMLRKLAIEKFFIYATENIVEGDKLVKIAEDIKKTRLKTKDSLHVACAIVAECDYFLSTDKRLLKYKDKRIQILNPIDFVLKGGFKV